MSDCKQKRALVKFAALGFHVVLSKCSGFKPAEVNNTFANTFKGNPQFGQVLLLVRDL